MQKLIRVCTLLPCLWLVGCAEGAPSEEPGSVATNAVVAPSAAKLRAPGKAETLQEIADQTAFVARGVVSAIDYEYSEETGPWTVITLSGVRSLVGQAKSDSVKIRQFGGPKPNGSTLTVSTVFAPSVSKPMARPGIVRVARNQTNDTMPPPRRAPRSVAAISGHAESSKPSNSACGSTS